MGRKKHLVGKKIEKINGEEEGDLEHSPNLPLKGSSSRKKLNIIPQKYEAEKEIKLEKVDFKLANVT
jgi:hypothetical protein